MSTNFWPKIKKTAEDISTLEINTILKSDMVCVKMSDNNILALYQLAKTYNGKITELGNSYQEAIIDNEKKNRIIAENNGNNYFRGKPEYQLAGSASFKELNRCARKAAKEVEKLRHDVSLPIEQVRIDEMILIRIEMQSYEICNILKNYEIEENIVGDKKTNIKSFLAQEDIKLKFRDRQVIQKALDLGIERVMMQTRIGMDGDITTRISEKFAANPQQFVLNIHNNSIDISVSFWKTLFDTLVKYGQKILSKI